MENTTEYIHALETLDALIANGEAKKAESPIYLGVDIGTANVVSVAVDAQGMPLGGIITPAKVTKEGIIVDYIGAVRIVCEQVQQLRDRLGGDITYAMSAVPPNTEVGNRKVTQNILESALLDVIGLIDEPVAASLVLGIKDGGIVDIGGGTTGFSMIRDGQVVYSTDEATGGFQFDLVIAGRYKITLEEALQKKLCKEEQTSLFHVVRPVMEKVASIVKGSYRDDPPETLYMVGGSSEFYGFRALMQKETGIATHLPQFPLLTTPYGIALACQRASCAGQ